MEYHGWVLNCICSAISPWCWLQWCTAEWWFFGVLTANEKNHSMWDFYAVLSTYVSSHFRVFGHQKGQVEYHTLTNLQTFLTSCEESNEVVCAAHKLLQKLFIYYLPLSSLVVLMTRMKVTAIIMLASSASRSQLFYHGHIVAMPLPNTLTIGSSTNSNTNNRTQWQLPPNKASQWYIDLCLVQSGCSPLHVQFASHSKVYQQQVDDCISFVPPSSSINAP